MNKCFLFLLFIIFVPCIYGSEKRLIDNLENSSLIKEMKEEITEDSADNSLNISNEPFPLNLLCCLLDNPVLQEFAETIKNAFNESV